MRVAAGLALLAVACGGSTSASRDSGGRAGASGACQDYVTADGFTCCCGQNSCSRTPGCLHGVTMTFPPASSDAGGGGQSGAPAAAYPAPHPDLPEVQSAGGAVLRAPRVVPIFFEGDSLQPNIERALAALPGSSYWAATTKEYGVGDLTLARSVVLSEVPPTTTTTDDIDAWLTDRLGSTAAWPPLTDDDIYTVFFPESTSITVVDQKSCNGFDGYHSEGVRRPSTNGSPPGVDAGAAGLPEGGGPLDSSFAYAVIARCRGALGEFSGLTVALSHELVEASTDPRVQTNPAYYFVDVEHGAWEFGLSAQPLGEVGDLCGYDDSPGVLVKNFLVQRTWSNQAALANKDPCVPEGPGTYFAAAPDFHETVSLGGQPTRGVRIPVGSTRTVDVRLFSSGPTPSWHVAAVEGPMSNPGRTLGFQWDKETGNNGDVLKLTITRSALGPLDGASVVVIYSSQDASAPGLRGNAWPGLVAD